MTFYRIYDLTSNAFISSRNSEVWTSLPRAKAYIKRLKTSGGYHRYRNDMDKHEYYVFEYNMPNQGYLFVEGNLISADIETVKTLYVKDI